MPPRKALPKPAPPPVSEPSSEPEVPLVLVDLNGENIDMRYVASPTYEVEIVEYLVEVMPSERAHEQNARHEYAKARLKELLDGGFHIMSSTAGTAKTGGALVVWTLVRAEGA